MIGTSPSAWGSREEHGAPNRRPAPRGRRRRPPGPTGTRRSPEVVERRDPRRGRSRARLDPPVERLGLEDVPPVEGWPELAVVAERVGGTPATSRGGPPRRPRRAGAGTRRRRCPARRRSGGRRGSRSRARSGALTSPLAEKQKLRVGVELDLGRVRRWRGRKGALLAGDEPGFQAVQAEPPRASRSAAKRVQSASQGVWAGEESKRATRSVTLASARACPKELRRMRSSKRARSKSRGRPGTRERSRATARRRPSSRSHSGETRRGLPATAERPAYGESCAPGRTGRREARFSGRRTRPSRGMRR